MNTEWINIVTRTSKRPVQFNKCVESVRNQTYKNINHIVITDDLYSIDYILKLGIKPYVINNILEKPKVDIPIGHRFSPYNLYLNEIETRLVSGFILYLDDDDILINNNIIEELMNKVNDKHTLYLFKVKIGERYVPGKSTFQNKPILNKFSGSGFLYHTYYYRNDLWPEYSGGDFVAGIKLYRTIFKNLWIDMTVVFVPKPHFGHSRE